MKIKLTYLLMSLFSASLHAEVIVDKGTDKQFLIKNNGEYIIDETHGSVSGNNLFHQFDRFNLSSSETAKFTGSENIKTVINRVTGKNASVINGNIVSDMNADFWFVNSNGIYIGDNATFDITGVLNLTTAGALEFDNGLEFGDGNIDVISINNDAAVIFNGVNVDTTDMDSLNIISRNINIHNSNIDIGGEFNLISVNKINTDLTPTEIVKGDNTVLNIVNTSIGQESSTENTTLLHGSTVFIENSEINNSTVQTTHLINAEKLNISTSTININTKQDIEISANYMVLEKDARLNINSESEMSLNFQMKGDQIYLRNEVNIDAVGTGTNHSISLNAADHIEISQSTIDSTGEIGVTSNEINISKSNITTSQGSLITLIGDNYLKIDENSIISPNASLPQSQTNQIENNNNLSDFPNENSDKTIKNMDGKRDVISETNSAHILSQVENRQFLNSEKIVVNINASPKDNHAVDYYNDGQIKNGIKSSKSTVLIKDTNDKSLYQNTDCNNLLAVMSQDVYLSASISNLDISKELDQGSSHSCL